MTFDIEQYWISKRSIIEQIKATHDWEKTEGFIADGVIVPEIYEKQELKILCMLGESYGYDECQMVDIEDQPTQNVLAVGKPRRQTSTKLPALLWLVFESLASHKKMTKDDFTSLLVSNEANIRILQNVVSKIAWVNVKKASRHIDHWGDDATRQNHKEIYDNAIRNKEVLRIQIESIAPDLIIVCSDPVFNSLFDSGLLGDGVQRGKKYLMQRNSKGQSIFQVSHPSYYRDWGYNGIYQMFEKIYDVISNK